MLVQYHCCERFLLVKRRTRVDNTCTHCCTKITNLTVKLGNNLVLDKVDLHIDCGEVVAVVGPNGAGKTTLLRTILGEMPYEGDIVFRVCGRDDSQPKIGYVPQKLQFDASAPISVTDLVAAAIGRRPVWAGINFGLLRKVRNVLAMFSVEHLYARKIGELSGGELQRVLLAMAMTPQPQLLLLDEPASGVDAKGLALFYQIVNDLRKKHDISAIMVTHDLGGVASFADRVLLLNRSLITQGTPQEVLSDSRLAKIFGPALLNLYCIPNKPDENKKD